MNVPLPYSYPDSSGPELMGKSAVQADGARTYLWNILANLSKMPIVELDTYIKGIRLAHGMTILLQTAFKNRYSVGNTFFDVARAAYEIWRRDSPSSPWVKAAEEFIENVIGTRSTSAPYEYEHSASQDVGVSCPSQVDPSDHSEYAFTMSQIKPGVTWSYMPQSTYSQNFIKLIDTFSTNFSAPHIGVWCDYRACSAICRVNNFPRFDNFAMLRSAREQEARDERLESLRRVAINEVVLSSVATPAPVVSEVNVNEKRVTPPQKVEAPPVKKPPEKQLSRGSFPCYSAMMSD